MATSSIQLEGLEAAPGERIRTRPSPALSRSLQILDRAATRIEQQRHHIAALQERATRAESGAATSLEEVEALKSLLAHAHDEIAHQREQIGAMQSQSEAVQDFTLTMILDLRERLAVAERQNSLQNSLMDAPFMVGGDDGRTPHRTRPN